MASTKGQIRDMITLQVRRLLAGGNTTNFRLDLREVELAINQTRDALVRNYFYQRYAQFGDFNVDATYIYPFKNVPVAYNEDSDEWYSELPCDTISLPNGREVARVRLMKDQKNDFIPLKLGMETLSRSNKENELENNIGFYRVGRKIVYVGIKKASNIEKVLIYAVSSGNDLPDDAEYIGGDIEEELVNRVISRIMPILNRAEDKAGNQITN